MAEMQQAAASIIREGASRPQAYIPKHLGRACDHVPSLWHTACCSGWPSYNMLSLQRKMTLAPRVV